jgi:hypothetical protein
MADASCVIGHANWVPEALEDGFKGRRVRRHSLLHAKILSPVARAESGKAGRLRRSLWASEFDPKPWLD